MQTRDQRYATDIYQQVLTISDTSKVSPKEAKRYGVMAHKLPILIHRAGLVQALAFVDSRTKEKDKDKSEQIFTRFLNGLASVVGQQDREQLLKSAREASLSQYVQLTQHVLDALLWYKRFAQSLLDVDATDALDDDTVPQNGGPSA